MVVRGILVWMRSSTILGRGSVGIEASGGIDAECEIALRGTEMVAIATTFIVTTPATIVVVVTRVGVAAGGLAQVGEGAAVALGRWNG